MLELNRSYRQAWSEGEVNEAMLDESAFGVGLYQTVDVYQRGERAVKYALLFIALTFLTFFAWEQITRNPLHPLQYLLVGLALSIVLSAADRAVRAHRVRRGLRASRQSRSCC